MKALILEQYNTPYKLTDLIKPVARERQVLVKIMASGVNPLDLKICEGKAAHARPQLPGIFGIDMAGIVEDVGNDVTEFKAGDEVYGMTGGVAGVPGSLAEYAAVDADLLALKPSTLSMKEAAAVPLIFITAWEALVDRANIKKDKRVLIHGGAGGVGHIAVQIALAHEAHVFATVNAAKAVQVVKYGATAIDYEKETVEQYVDAYTKGKGFDIILDTVGGTTLDDSFKAARQYKGHVVSALGWGSHSLAPLSFHGATYSGVFTLYPLISGKRRRHHGNILSQATELINAGKVIPKVDPINYNFDTISDAYDSLRKKTATGKVVVNVGMP